MARYWNLRRLCYWGVQFSIDIVLGTSVVSLNVHVEIGHRDIKASSLVVTIPRDQDVFLLLSNRGVLEQQAARRFLLKFIYFEQRAASLSRFRLILPARFLWEGIVQENDKRTPINYFETTVSSVQQYAKRLLRAASSSLVTPNTCATDPSKRYGSGVKIQHWPNYSASPTSWQSLARMNRHADTSDTFMAYSAQGCGSVWASWSLSITCTRLGRHIVKQRGFSML